MARPKARWTGVLRFPDLGVCVDGWLHSYTGQSKEVPPIVQIHIPCSTKVEVLKSEKGKKEKEESVAAPAQMPTPVTRNLHCPTCNRPVLTNEVGEALDTEAGLVPITPQEKESLAMDTQKEVDVQLTAHDSEVLATVGTGRRLYFFPRGNSVQEYYEVWRAFDRSRCVGFIPELVVDRKSYVLVLFPLRTAPEVFGGKRRRVLIAEELNDPLTLKSPDTFKLLPEREPRISKQRSDELVRRAKKAKRPLDFPACEDPLSKRKRRLAQVKLSSR